MRITKFEIKNFKGIEHASINLNDDTPGNVGTLIGLNESGKTTVLEALSYFETEDKDTANLVETVHRRASLHDLIPKDKKAAFTGEISIKALVIVEEPDVQAIAEMLKEEYELYLDCDSFRNDLSIERVYIFEDSNYVSTKNRWTIDVKAKSKRQKSFKSYGSSEEFPEIREVWLSCVDVLRNRLPKIVYFPTFLFDFPDRIYLKGDDSDTNLYYKQVIQDVLDGQGEALDIQRHIVDRISRMKEEHPAVTTFMAFLFGRDEKKQIDAVLQKAANKMGEVIFGSWNEILGKNVTGKRVQIDWLLDGDNDNAPYIELSIVDGQSTYSLSERSLGFRWFFSFLLFTQFRKNRKDNGATIFLFDEPAANLHSKAQMKLLDSFSRIAHGSTFIIYSTHSHYMVNPLWLEKAYIVENRAADYENEDDVGSFAVRKTDISAIRYKTFVGSNPTKTTYFQPVLDALDIGFSPLIRSTNAIVVEGKNDYYGVRYLRQLNCAEDNFQIFPSNGAGSSSTLISLFRGWGVKFRVLVDDDAAGKQAKKKYMDEFLLSNEEVVTLGEISSSFSGQTFEAVYQSDLTSAAEQFFDTNKITKRHFALYCQHLLMASETKQFPETMEAFEPISKWMNMQFG